MTNAEILTEFRDIYGLDLTLYPDATLNKFIEKARKKISEHYPALELTSLVTVKDQTRYTVTHTGLIKVKQVFYRQGYSTDIDLFGDTDIKSSMQNYNSTFFPSQSFEFIQRMKLLRDMFPMDAEIVSNNQFDLIPTPNVSDEVVYYEYARYRTLAEIPDMFMDDVCNLGMYYYGEKQTQEALMNPKGNKYNFDRRGNINASDSQNEAMQKSRKIQLDAVLKSIKDKVWGL